MDASLGEGAMDGRAIVATPAFENAVEAASDGIVLMDGEGRVTYFNRAAEVMFGRTRGEVLGRSLTVLMPASYREAHERGLARFLATNEGPILGKVVSVEGERADGTAFPIELTVSASRAGGEVLFTGVIRDVTERRRAEAALHASEERYRHLFEASPLPMWVFDVDTLQFIDVNDAAVRHYGYSRDEFAAMTIKDIRPREDVEALLRDGGRRSMGPDVGRWRHVKKDGTVILVEVSANTFRLAGRLVRLVLANDVTEAERAREAVLRAEENFRTLVQSLSLAVVVLRGDAILYANDVLARYLGHRVARDLAVGSLGELLDRHVHPDDRAAVAANAPGAGATAGSSAPVGGPSSPPAAPFEVRLCRSDGGVRKVEAYSLPVLFDGAPARVLVLRDVTAYRELQARVLQAERMASVGTLAAGVAHEINNPLAYVLSNVSVAVEDLARLEARVGAHDPDLAAEIHAVVEPLREALGGAERVRNIVRDLKVFSRADEHAEEPVDVRRVLDASMRMAQNEIRHRARLRTDFGETPPVLANDGRLGQVFLNLLMNAAHAIPEGAVAQNEIALTTRSEGANVVVEVRDTGAGIAPEHVRRLFDPFFTTKPVGVGTGLGLSICHGIVASLGGSIEVESEVGRGSLFRVVLPATVPRAPAAKRESAGPAPGRRARVLVVDDEPLVGKAVRRALGKEHDVAIVGGGEAALELLEAGRRFDVIVCDLMMPTMSGMELHAEIAQRARDQAGRVVFMTGGAFTATARAFLEATPNPRLEKPFDPQTLRELLREMLDR